MLIAIRHSAIRLLEWFISKLGGPDLFEVSFEHASIGMALVGLDGRWIRINPALTLILERSEKEILAHTFQNYTPEDGGLEDDLAYLQECLKGERTGYTMRKAYRMPDGRSKHVRLSVALVRIDNRPLLFISQITDIDGEVRLEGELRKALEREQAIRASLEKEVEALRDDDGGSISQEFQQILDTIRRQV